MLVERQFDTGKVIINYAENEGPRPPLLLLHGATLWWRYFLPVLTQLSLRWHTMAPDLRGHGHSGRVADGYRIEDFAEDCLALMRSFLSEPAVLLGHSLGGLVAIQLAAQHPELVRALVLEDPPLHGERDSTLAQNSRFVFFRDLAASGLPLRDLMGRLAHSSPDRDASWLRWKARSLSLLDPETLNMEFDGRMAQNFDLQALLPLVGCPVLLLRGDPAQGGRITDEDEAAALSTLKDAAVVRFPGVGHPIATTTPDVYVRVVSDFLESLE
jgi:pimeloyl-ACP methyl ester carboxylesterase